MVKRSTAIFLTVLLCVLGLSVAPRAAAAMPVVSIADPLEVVEGNDGTTEAVFIVSLSKRSRREVKVDYTTVDAEAVGGSDLVSKSGTLRFKPGKKTKNLRIQVISDAIHESYETFSVKLSEPRRASLGDDEAVGAIIDDDPFPLGGVIISEIKADPIGADTSGEWMELYNPTGVTQELHGLTMRNASGAHCNMIGEVPPGGHRVLAGGFDPPGAINCGSLDLLNQGDTLKITPLADPTRVIDETSYSAATEGASRSLDPESHTASGNDTLTNWCDDATGTPGAANGQCPA